MHIHRKHCFTLVLLILLVLLSACSLENTATDPTFFARSEEATATDPAAPTAAATDEPSMMPTAELPQETPVLQPGDDWQVHRNEALGIRLRYPPEWEVISATEIRGDSGFIQMESIPSTGLTPLAFCQITANQGIPARFGQYPMLQVAYYNHFQGCIISPSVDAPEPNTASAYLWSDADAETILHIQTGLMEMQTLLEGIEQLTPQATLAYNDTLPAACRLNDSPPETWQSGSLTFERYPLTTKDCQENINVEAFAMLTPQEARDKARELSTLTPDYLERVNQLLQPFDYRIEERFLYHGSENILPVALEWIGMPEVNASETDFLLPVRDYSNGKTYLISNGQVNELSYINESALGYVPTSTFLGDELITVSYDQEHLGPAGAPVHLIVQRDDEIVFRFTTLPFFPGAGPVRGLWSDQAHWYLELPDLLIRDGEVLNVAHGYQAMFTYRQPGGKTFYFYQDNGEIFMVYDGETLPVRYQEVINEPGCCSAAMVNMTLGYNGLAFYALQDGFWYYTIITPAS